MIFYFTGTGNSLHVAKIIAEEIDDELCSMNEMIMNESKQAIISERSLVFVSPVYAWRLPIVIEKLIDRMEFKGNKDAYFILTCDSEPGSSERYLKRLCIRKGFTYKGMASVLMPENLLTMFDIDDEETCAKKISIADIRTKGLADAMADGCVLTDDKPRNIIKSAVGNPLFYRFFVKPQKFYSTNGCTSCGGCADNCPLGNIRLIDGKPIWGKECTMCMSCISRCPTESIEYGRKTKGRRRYHLDE